MEWNKKFNALPDELRDPLMEKTAEIKRIMSRFDEDNSGKIFVTIDRAFDMAWLQSLRAISRSRVKLGKTVKAKFNTEDMELARREINNAQQLNELLKEMATSKFRGTGSFDILMQGMREQLANSVARLEKEKGEIGVLAKDLKKTLVKHFRPDLEHIYRFTSAKSYFIDEAGKARKRQVVGANTEIKYNQETGKYEPVLDSDGKPMRLSEDPENLITEGELKDIMENRFLDQIDEERYHSVMEDAGAFWHPIYDAKGKLIKRQMAFRDLIPDSDHYAVIDEGSYKLQNLERKSKQEADDAYKNITGLNVKVKDATDAKPSAITSEQLNRITANIGKKLLQMQTPTSDILNVAKGLKSVGGTEGSFVKLLGSKRIEALADARKRMGDEEFATFLDKFIKNNPELAKEYAKLSVKPFKIIGGRPQINEEGIETWMGIIGGKIDIELNPDIVKLDMSLADLKDIRTDLMSTMIKTFDTKDKRMIGHFHRKMADAITTEFDEIGVLKDANQKYSKYMNEWHEGTNKKLYSILYDTKNKNFDDIFDNYIDISGRGARGAREDFDSIALQVDPDTGERVYSDILKKNLQLAVENRVRNGQKIDGRFYQVFGDLLNFENSNKGYDGLTDLGLVGDNVLASRSSRANDLGQQLNELINRPMTKATAFGKKLEKLAEKDYETLGIPLNTIQEWFGKNVGDEIALRKEILKDTYAGGDPTRVLAVAEHIDNIDASKMINIQVPDPKNVGKFITKTVSQKSQAKAGLQKLLLNGALEEAFRLRRIKGIDFEPVRVKESVAEDGTKLLETVDGNFKQTMELDSSALGIYIERNQKTLEKILDPDQLQDLKDINSLASLVIGELPNQAIENMPREMRWQSVMSRVYNVVRGVVSPRYVITELLIQDARYRRGRLLMDMASDPDAFGMLSEVILRDGLQNKQIRTEFIDWFKQGLVRTGREIVEEEEAFLEEDIHGLSDSIWETSGHDDGLNQWRYE